MDAGSEAATLMGELDAALLWSDRLLSLHPDSIPAKDMRIYALLACGRAADALELAESILDTNPLNQHAWAIVATALGAWQLVAWERGFIRSISIHNRLRGRRI